MRYKEEETLESYRKRMNPYKTWKIEVCMFKLLMYFWENRKEDEESNVFMNSHFTIFMKSQRKRFFSFYLFEWLLKTVESALNQLLITKLVFLLYYLVYCTVIHFYFTRQHVLLLFHFLFVMPIFFSSPFCIYIKH